LGVDNRVDLLGEREDVAAVMQSADVLLVPSWEEPFGRVVVEGMAMETPVVATAVGGPPEILRGGKGGYVLPPRQPELWAEEVDRLLADPARCLTLGRGGRARAVEGFGVEGHVEPVLAVYEGIAGDTLACGASGHSKGSASRGVDTLIHLS